MAADIIGVSFSFWEETIKLVESETGIPKENILLCGTHTHGGPNYRLSRYESPPPEIISYRNELKEKCVTTLKEAIDNLRPASIGAGKGECKMNMNRRVRSAPGEIILGKNPYGPCYHEVGVVRVLLRDT